METIEKSIGVLNDLIEINNRFKTLDLSTFKKLTNLFSVPAIY